MTSILKSARVLVHFKGSEQDLDWRKVVKNWCGKILLVPTSIPSAGALSPRSRTYIQSHSRIIALANSTSNGTRCSRPPSIENDKNPGCFFLHFALCLCVVVHTVHM
jgi:hypothetical protein